jgi:hypothetical protein
MLNSIRFDIAGPEVLLTGLAVGCVIFFLGTLIIILIEAAVLKLLKWGTFGRSLLAVFVANIVTTLIGLVWLVTNYLGLGSFALQIGISGSRGLILAFILSVVIEAGILMLFKRGAARENWVASLVANVASYLLVIFPAYLLF